MPKLLKPSQALKRVKSMIPAKYNDCFDQSPYICDNIRDLWRGGQIDDVTKDQLTAHIRGALDNAFSLKEWLIGNRHITVHQFNDDVKETGGKMIQHTRQLWLNDMITYFKSKGM